MNPVLLLPAALAALAALAVPLLLHLARREDRRPIDFAALRWLSERARPRRRLRVEEPWLLALRLLLVALLALLLARPALEGNGADTPWIVAAPGVDADALRPVPSDAAVERRWLAPGFPSMDQAPPAGGHLPLASLLRELDLRMPPDAPLLVVVPPVLDGMDAERPRLSRPVDWRVVDAPARPVPDAPASRPAPPRLVFLPDDGDAPWLRAAAEAWRAVDGLPATEAGAPEVRVWTRSAPLPAAERDRVAAGATVLLAHDATIADDRPDPDGGPSGRHAAPATGDHAATLWADSDGRPLLQASRLGRGRILQWTRPLEPAVFPGLLEPDFPHRLREALQPLPPPARVLAAQHAPDLADIGPWPVALHDLRPWLAVLAALLFVLERWLAAAPRRNDAEATVPAETRDRIAPEQAP